MALSNIYFEANVSPLIDLMSSLSGIQSSHSAINIFKKSTLGVCSTIIGDIIIWYYNTESLSNIINKARFRSIYSTVFKAEPVLF